MPSDNEYNGGNAELSNNDCIEDKNALEARIDEHTKAIEHLKEKSKNLKVQQKGFAEHMEESFKLLRARVTDVHDVLKRETKAVEEAAVLRHLSANEDIQTLYARQDQDHESVISLEESLKWLLRNDTTEKLTNLTQDLDLHLKLVIELLREKDLTSEETTNIYDSLLRMLTENINEAKELHTQELSHQLGRLCAKTKKCIWAQASCEADVENVQATLEAYAKENQSLKDKIDEQESTVTALKGENLIIKSQISCLLFSIRMMEAKVDCLSTEVRNTAKSTK